MIDEKNKDFYISIRHKNLVHRIFPKAYLKPSHASRIGLLMKIVNNFQPLTIS